MFPDFPDLIFPVFTMFFPSNPAERTPSPHRLVDVTTPPRVPVALPAALRESGATPGGSREISGGFIDVLKA